MLQDVTALIFELFGRYIVCSVQTVLPVSVKACSLLSELKNISGHGLLFSFHEKDSYTLFL